MLQTEFRHVGKNSSLVTDFGFTRGYKSKFLNKKKNISHFFGKLDIDLNLDEFNSSKFYLNLQKISSDTYLKVFDSNIVNKKLKPDNFDELKNELRIDLNHKKYTFNSGFRAFENLQKKNSDRYQFVFPYYNFNTIISEDFFEGFLTLNSSGTNDLKNTNNLRTKVINDLSYKSYDFISKLGIKNKININLKNLNSLGKNDDEYKSSPQLELLGDIELQSHLPLIKKTEEYFNFFIPKLSLRFSPNDMKDYSDSERNINTDNIFANNRIGVDDTLESGDPLLLD